jgi:pimeloyl-ACP methyl ester carboxylesterase
VSSPLLAYEESGTGQPLLLLHGFPHDRAVWAPQVAGLVDRCRCIVPDLRGFGDSPVTPPFTMDRYADDVVELMDALRIESAVVCGLSMGGYIAFSLWRRHRARIRALILLDTKAGPDGEEAKKRRELQVELVRASGSAALAPRLVEPALSRRTRERHPDVVERLVALMSRQPAEGVVGALQAMIRRVDSTPTLATIDVPTLVIVGDEDVATPPDEARKIHDRVRGSTLEIIEGAGHLANLERPAAVNHLISEFVGRLIYA